MICDLQGLTQRLRQTPLWVSNRLGLCVLGLTLAMLSLGAEASALGGVVKVHSREINILSPEFPTLTNRWSIAENRL